MWIQVSEYKQLLIQSIVVKFSEAVSVVHTLVEFLNDSNNPSPHHVITFIW
jgi:coatomer subunit beta